MTAASKYGSPQKLPCGGKPARRTRFPWGETGVFGEGTDECSRGARRGMGPSTYARVAEIMSGRAISQQGLAPTCKDLAHKGEPEARGGVWSGAWARRSDEGGVTPSEATHEVVPTRGNTLRGRRSPGHSVATERGCWEDMAGSPVQPPPASSPVHLSHPGLGGGQTTEARGVCVPALELPLRWEGPFSYKWRAEPRPEPDSGNPTVRDRRGALRTVTMGAGLRPGAKAPEEPPDPTVRALNFYPDNRLHGSKGGWGTGLA